MILQLNFSNLTPTPAIEGHIETRVQSALRRFASRLTRVEVHVADLNGQKHGTDDKRVVIEARPAGMDPISVESRGADLYEVVRAGTRKLRDVLARTTERERDRKR